MACEDCRDINTDCPTCGRKWTPRNQMDSTNQAKVVFIASDGMVQVEDMPTHLLIHLPGASVEQREESRHQANQWLANGGSLIIGADDVRLKATSAPVPDGIVMMATHWKHKEG